ncbi:MAG TPA: FecR domain-containing protein [Puia sp.]|nr:FecR domain-containing protein [Puia sp.]
MRDQQLLQTMQHIGGLFFRRLHDDLNEADRIALDEWMDQRDPVSRQFFEEMTDWEQIQAALQSLYQFDVDSAFEEVQKKIHLETVLAIPAFVKSRMIWRRRSKYIAAAIVLTLIIGVSVVFTLTKRKTDMSSLPVAQRFKNDVPPGGDKAILTLTDGSNVVLDSASNGELAKQGTTRILKLDNGQISYDAHPSSSQVVSYNTISTPRGGQYQIQLSDGSKVWLNASSSLKYPTAFIDRDRNVELSGEAYFEVAGNKQIPFKVAAGNMSIQVLGTHFDVSAYKEDLLSKTTLIEGAVKVSRGSSELQIHPGEQAQVIATADNGPIRRLESADINTIVAWRNGITQFRNSNIKDIMHALARWYDIEVEYRDSIDKKFTGKIPRNVNISAVLSILEATGSIRFSIEGRKVVVMAEK